ncbi:Protein kinase-like domain containing protein [Hyaloscypha variabilis]
MEPVADMDLERFLDGTKKALQVPEEISQWFGCLINALAFLHEMDITQGEINPKHILISNNSVLLTCSTHYSSLFHNGATTKLPSSRAQIESDRYIPPEVTQGHSISRKSDIFSLGVVFIEMLVVGTQPQRDEEFSEIFFNPREEVWDSESVAKKWTDFFGQSPEKHPWQSKIAVLSAEMLSNDYRERLQAGDIRLWWSCQPSTSLPSTSCKCGLAASVKDPQSPTKTKEALEMARAKGYTLSVEFLSGKAEEPSIKTARWGVKEAKQKKQEGSTPSIINLST